jgi:hypothetical protein
MLIPEIGDGIRPGRVDALKLRAFRVQCRARIKSLLQAESKIVVPAVISPLNGVPWLERAGPLLTAFQLAPD